MSKRAWILLTVILVLCAGYVYFFSGWLTPRQIRVVAQLRLDPQNARARAHPDPTTAAGVYPIVFSLDRSYALTSVAVFTASDLEFEKDNAKPIWHMVIDDAAERAPIRAFRYGRPIKGMKPADPANPHAAPLLPGTMYRVVVEMGRAKGATDFQTREVSTQQQ